MIFKPVIRLTTAAALAVAGLSATAASRPLHYRPLPDGSGAYTVNGDRKYIRGLYGAHTGFRMDCGDMPEFGIYLPRMGGNMRFTLPEGDCEATYVPGRMEYSQGGVIVEAQVLRSSDAALWKLTNTTRKKLTIGVRFGGVADKKFSREGDLGVDRPDCFDLKPEYCEGNVYTLGKNGLVTVEYGKKERKTISLVFPADKPEITAMPSYEGTITLKPGQSRYVALFPAGVEPVGEKMLPALFAKAEAERAELASAFSMSTPDAWINPVGNALSVAADGIWSGEAWLHGSIGWRTPHLGWRGAYAGDALGLHDRALTHFRTYAANQVTDIPPVLEHPRQDLVLNLARAEKRWGTPMYSNGYICRRPGKKDEMSHYDMNLVYVDAMLRHFRHTADTAAMRELFPVVKLHLDWEKRNFDPDGDHLYDAYCCIWASDALYYSGGSVTHSSAYNMLANKLAADVADAIGEDSAPYRAEAEAIGRAIDSVLWIGDRGHWAEFKDYGPEGRLHPAAALWTVYHAIDSEVGDPFENYAATVYVDREIPHIPVEAEGIDEPLYTLSTTNWKPYSWSINNVAIAEVIHTALAYWQAGRPEEAYRLMKGTVIDNMYLGASPLNFGQISWYDVARGECYRDFADPIGVWSRAITEGLYGIRPVRIGQDPRVDVIPGFPAAWNEASISLPEIGYEFTRNGAADTYVVDNRYPAGTVVRLSVPASGIDKVMVNGKEVTAVSTPNTIGEPRVTVNLGDGSSTVTVKRGRDVAATPTGATRDEGGVRFKEMAAGPLTWWEAEVVSLPAMVTPLPEDFTAIDASKCSPVKLDGRYNARVSDIFKNEYLSPRPPVTTLQLPTQGTGEWCHPKAMFDIDDEPLRAILAAKGDTLPTALGIDFVIPSEGNNTIYTTLWDNYPASTAIPLDGKASHIYLLMAGSTNHMQWGMENARLTAVYTDGTTATLPLINPLNWAPIEQDFYTDDHAYAQPGGAANPYRLCFADGRVSRNLLDDMAGKKVAIDGGMELGAKTGRAIPGGAGVLVDFPVDADKELAELRLETISRDDVVGIMAVTLQRP
ncbi:MAG: DUF4450 domain-containing protein [[Clostridium] fimetarium]|nr:DUF4450 domain-containing protein [Alistipes timonensis]MCM1405015.1 DUF4450 domain-containing protein [[Clostridium] fimetarium]